MPCKARPTTVFFSFLSSCCAMFCSLSVQGQASGPAPQAAAGEHIVPRVIWTTAGNRSYPLGTMALFYDGKPIKSTVPFDAPDDWLKHISVSFENRSFYALTAGSVQLDFRRLDGSPIYYLKYGALPEHALYAHTGKQVPRPPNEVPISIAPGARMLISFEPYYAAILSAIGTGTPLSEVTFCGIDYKFQYFGKDLRWGIGSFARADPSAPGNYVEVAPEQFMPKLEYPK